MQQVILLQVLKALTARRVWNALLNVCSFIVSAVTKKPLIWGFPPIVNIEPTNRCNLKCPLCATGSGLMRRPPGDMDWKRYTRLIDQVADRAIYLTLYAQGEPFLHRQIYDFIRYAKAKRLYITTSSNGHFFNRRQAEQTVQSGLDSLIISLDGATEETYQRYRRGGSLEKVLQGIGNLVAAKKRFHSKTPYLFLQFLVMRHNESEISVIKQLARRLSVDRLLIKTTEIHNIEEAQTWLPKNSRYHRYNLSDSSYQVKNGRGACPRPWLTTLVDWDGTIVPCCFDKHGDHPMDDGEGHQNFHSIWTSAKYQQFRSILLADREKIAICRQCNFGIKLFR